MMTDKIKLDEIVHRQLKINPCRRYWYDRHMVQASRYKEWAEEEWEEETREYWEEWARKSYILAKIFLEK